MKAIVILTCGPDLRSYAHPKFQWPELGSVECDPEKEGRGLMWGQGDHSLLNYDLKAKWVCLEVDMANLVDHKTHVRFSRGHVIYTGDFDNAFSHLALRAPVFNRITDDIRFGDDNSTIHTGFYSTAMAGHNSRAVAGMFGRAITGDFGFSFAGTSGLAITGKHGTATAGPRGIAIAHCDGRAQSGDYGKAIAGLRGSAKVGDWGSAVAGDFGKASAGVHGGACVGAFGTAIVKSNGAASAGEGGTLIFIPESGQKFLIVRVDIDGLNHNELYTAERARKTRDQARKG